MAAAFRLPVTLLTKESTGALIEPTAALLPHADYPCRFNVIAGLGEHGGEINGDGCLTLLITHPDDHSSPDESHLRFCDFAIVRLSGRERLAGGGRAPGVMAFAQRSRYKRRRRHDGTQDYRGTLLSVGAQMNPMTDEERIRFRMAIDDAIRKIQVDYEAHFDEVLPEMCAALMSFAAYLAKRECGFSSYAYERLFEISRDEQWPQNPSS